jgi:hypothetical protein
VGAEAPDTGVERRTEPAADVSVRRRPRRAPARGRYAPWAALGIVAVVAGAVILHAGHGLGFFYDEWTWIIGRRNGSLNDLLANHNGHLNLLPVVAYKVMWSIFGLTNYTAFRVMLVIVHLVTCLLLFALVRRHAPLWFAFSATTVMLFLGYAWQDLLWPFQIQFIGAVGAGLAALLLVERNDRVGDVGACIAVATALACSGVGLPFAGGVLLLLALRREWWYRLWVALVPLALYGIWYLKYGTSQVKASNAHLVPSYAARAGAASIGALFGTSMANGRYLIGVLVVVTVVVLGQRRKISPWTAVVIAMPVGYWILTGLSRAELQEPDASRYLYPGVVFVVLLLSSLLGRTAPRLPRWGVITLIVAVVAFTALSLRGNLHQLDGGAAGLRDASNYVSAELGALALVRDRVDPSFQPDPQRAPQISAGGYFRAIDDLGSPADTLAELRARPDAVRSSADAMLARALGADRLREAAAPAPDGVTAPEVTNAARGAPVTDGSCLTFTPNAPLGAVEIGGPNVDVDVTASAGNPVQISVRNLADQYESPAIATVAPGANQRLVVPEVRTGPWHVLLTSDGPFRVCSPAGRKSA